MQHNIFSSKQAITTTVFSWIFMSIIGGVLIVTTYSILSSYWNIEDENNRIEFAKSLTNTLNVRAQGVGVQSATTFNTFPLLANREASFQCIGGEFTRLSLNNDELIYEPLNDYLDKFPIVMAPLDEEVGDNIFLVQENFNFPMAISPLVGIVSTRHIIVINESSQIRDIIGKVLNDKRSYRQLSFEVWDTDEMSENEMKSYLESLNPSSIAFLGFEDSYINSYIENEFSGLNYPVYHIKPNFSLTPSYLNPANDDKIIIGNFSYTYSNSENDFAITNQEAAQSARSFNFYGTNDEISLLMFSLFSTPSNFECAYNSLQSRTEFVYQHAKEKIKIILNDSGNTNSTYCQSSRDSTNLDQFYDLTNISLSEIYANSTHNIFNGNSQTSASTEIKRIEELNLDLRVESCQLIY